MKYLINHEFQAIRKGDFVQADSDHSEFIFDSENPEQSVATILEIADAMKVKVTNKKAKKADLAIEVSDLLETLKIDEVNKMSLSDKIKAIVEENYVEAETQDERASNDMQIQIEIASAGLDIAFKDIAKRFNEAMESLGYAISPANRQKAADKLLDEAGFDPQDHGDVLAAVAKIVSGVPKTTDADALKCVRKYAKENEITLPKKPSTPSGFRPKMLAWILDNPHATREEMTDHVVNDLKRDEKRVQLYWELMEQCRAYAKAVSSTEEAEQAAA